MKSGDFLELPLRENVSIVLKYLVMLSQLKITQFQG
jgi:hypothetical protein